MVLIVTRNPFVFYQEPALLLSVVYGIDCYQESVRVLPGTGFVIVRRVVSYLVLYTIL